MSYKVDCQDGNVRYVNSLDHARAYAYNKFRNSNRKLPIIIYSASGRESGMVSKDWNGMIQWVTFSAKKGSIHKRLFEDGKVR